MERILVSIGLYGRESDDFEDGDFNDRLNNRYTILGLIGCIFIISGNLYVGNPINCWTPGMFEFLRSPKPHCVF